MIIRKVSLAAAAFLALTVEAVLIPPTTSLKRPHERKGGVALPPCAEARLKEWLANKDSETQEEQEIGIPPMPEMDEAAVACPYEDGPGRIFCEMSNMVHDKAAAIREMLNNIEDNSVHDSTEEHSEPPDTFKDLPPCPCHLHGEGVENEGEEVQEAAKLPIIIWGGPKKFEKFRHNGATDDKDLDGDNKGTAASAYHKLHRHCHGFFHRHRQWVMKVARGLKHFILGFVMPVLIGIMAGVTVSVLGMIIGSGVACMWFRVMYGRRRGREESLHEEESQPLVSDVEKEVLLRTEPEVGEEAPPVYVEKE